MQETNKNYIEIGIFCFLVVDGIYRWIINGNYLMPFILYFFIGFSVWFGTRMNNEKFNVLKIMFLWLPALWIKRLNNWCRNKI